MHLQGGELENWYSMLNQSPEAREELTEVMIREGMLLVKLWNGKDWQYSDFIWEVGPSVPKDQVVRLNISDIPGDILKVKLESITGFWVVNCVQADYSIDSSIKVQELSPCYAENHLGEDIKEYIGLVDHQYYVMPKFNSWADVKFSALPNHKGYERSFILKCTGYYTIDIESEGDPKHELIAKFMNEPGAYGQYTIGMLQKYTEQYFAHIGDMKNEF